MELQGLLQLALFSNKFPTKCSNSCRPSLLDWYSHKLFHEHVYLLLFIVKFLGVLLKKRDLFSPIFNLFIMTSLFMFYVTFLEIYGGLVFYFNFLLLVLLEFLILESQLTLVILKLLLILLTPRLILLVPFLLLYYVGLA